MTRHIDNIITSCARVLYGLRTLRRHGMPTPALRAVFQSIAVAKVTYAAPAWWVSLTLRIAIALRPLTAEQLGMVTANSLLAL